MSKKRTNKDFAQRINGLYEQPLEEKSSEKVMAEAEESHRTILENIEDGYYEVDLSGNFIFFNDSICRILGYSKDELLGLNNREYMSRETAKEVFRIFNRIYQTGTSEKDCEWVFIRKDGTKKFVETSPSLIKDKKGTPTGFRGILRDITERRRDMEELRASEAKYRATLDSIEESYFEVDLKGNFTFFNDSLSKLIGYSKDRLIGMNNCDYMTPESAKKIYLLFNQMFKTGNPIQKVHYEIIKGDGNHRINELSASLMKDNTGEGIGFRGIARDITEVKNAEEEKKKLEGQLIYAQRMESIGTLAGGIAHNFNNLLMGIQGNASIILLDIDPDHPYHKNLRNIEQLVKNGSKLTHQLLGYAREGKYEVRPISLNHVVKEACHTFSEARKEIGVHSELADRLYGLKADQGQIKQVLMNLFVNAADAMPGGGDLTVMTENVTNNDIVNKPYHATPGNYILLTVKDSGRGMDSETMERIFDPFFTTKGLAKGTGLGLASVYGIVKAHGGYIDVDSEKGQGSTFTIYLPATETEVKEGTELSGELLKGEETILFVDDEELILDAGGQMLEMLGYKTILSNSGREALEKYKNNQENIHLVLLDMVMPDMGGGETYDKIKELNPDVKVLLASGYSVDGQATEILRRGCNGFIQKPFDLIELSHKIREIFINP